MPEYIVNKLFIVKKYNYFENYLGNGKSLYEYRNVFDDDSLTYLELGDNKIITAKFDEPKAFGGFYIDGDNISSYKIQYVDLDTDKIVEFNNQPVKTDKLVFEFNGINIILRDIFAFCSSELDHLLSNENLPKIILLTLI